MAATGYSLPARPFIVPKNSADRPYLVPGSASLDYPRGTQLCLEGCAAGGIFRIVEGHAKECFTSETGKMAIVRIAGPGDLVGLEAVLGSGSYATTVQTLELTKACFITRRDLLGALRCDESFRKEVVQQLSDRCKTAYADIRRFALVSSVAARVAHFLLDWKKSGIGPEDGATMRINLTREEIGQLICSSRETVSRIVTSFSRKGWIRVNGVCWRIQNRQALCALIQR